MACLLPSGPAAKKCGEIRRVRPSLFWSKCIFRGGGCDVCANLGGVFSCAKAHLPKERVKRECWGCSQKKNDERDTARDSVTCGQRIVHLRTPLCIWFLRPATKEKVRVEPADFYFFIGCVKKKGAVVNASSRV